MSYELQRADRGLHGFLKAMTMTNTDRVNSRNRSIAEYRPCDIEAFFNPQNGVYNALISGGNPQLRTNAMVAQAVCASSNGFPVVILHEGNHQLEQLLRNCFWGGKEYIEVSPNSPCFEPLYGLTELEISSLCTETAPKDYDLKYNARYYIDGISAILKASGKNCSFNRLSNCPHSSIFDKVDALETGGKISSDVAHEIKSKLMVGQSENYKLDTYLANLRMQMEPILYQSGVAKKPVNILSAIKGKAILCLDASSVTNKLLINVLIYQLKLAMTKREQYKIIIDSIPIDANEAYSEYMRAPSDKVLKTVASEDFYSTVGGDDKLFSAVVGNTQTIIVMNHQSNHNATKWSEVFGQYDKWEQSFSTSKGGSLKTPFSLLPSPHYGKTTSVSKNREYIVKPEAISRLGDGEAYIRSAALGELCHTCFIE